jgi:hypothetical protein
VALESEPSAGDRNGRLVHRFAITMANLGLTQAGTELEKMYDSGIWREFEDGLGHYRFLPGEFDYFLTQQGIMREDVMVIPDVKLKAKLEEGMDERRTGGEGYRRRIIEVRQANPTRPARPIEPFGLTKKEAATLREKGMRRMPRSDRPALGGRVRRWKAQGTTLPSREVAPRWQRLAVAVARLSDEDFDAFQQLVNERRIPPNR